MILNAFFFIVDNPFDLGTFKIKSSLLNLFIIETIIFFALITYAQD